MIKNIDALVDSNDFDHEQPTQADNNLQNNHFFRYYRSLSVNDDNKPSHYYQLSPEKTVIGSTQSCKSLNQHDTRPDLFEMDDIDVVKERIEHSPSDDEISDMEEIRKKNCFQRICRPIASGSVRSSIVTLISGCAGVGMLGQPKVMSYFGLVLGCILFISCGGLAYLSISILCEAMQISGKRRYPNLVSYFLGKKSAKVFSKILIGVVFGIVIQYVVALWNLVQHVIYKYKLFPLDLTGTDVSNITVVNYGPNTMKTRAVVLSIIYLISLNLICVKDLSGFRYIGIANIFIYAFVMILIIVQFYPIRSYYMLEKNYDIDYFYNEPKLCWASGFATILLAFLSHPTFFNIRDEQSAPSPKRVLKIVRISIVMETILFLVIGIFGYLSLGNSHMVDMFVLRESVGSLDYLIEGAIYAFILLNFYGVLIIFYSFREQVFSEFNMKRSLFDRAKVTIIGLGLCFLIAIFAPNMTQAFGVVGGMFCTLMGWIVPFLIKIRIQQNQGYPWYSCKRVTYQIALIQTIFVSQLSTVQSIFQL